MLGRTERESPVHTALAASLAGWSGLRHGEVGEWDSTPPAPVELLDLGGITQTLATVAAISDLAAVVALGHPEQPSAYLESALLAADATLAVTAVVPVTTQWVWVGSPEAGTGAVVLDEAAHRDCRDALRPFGVSPRLVSGRTPVAERLQLAGPGGSLVLERPRVPEGLVELPGSERLNAAPVWYGLVSAGPRPDFSETAQVWLAFGPSSENRGSLARILELVAGAGIDLQHLRSQRSPAGPHQFYTSFSCADDALLRALEGDLDARGVAHRTLAVLPGRRFAPGPATVAPQWQVRRL